MGLNTSHGCWDGPYSAFMRWRIELARVAGYPALLTMEGFAENQEGVSWDPYENDALTILLNHSDCDGKIKKKECAKLADRLEELLPLLKDWYKDKCQLFIDGLRLAHERNEKVEFH